MKLPRVTALHLMFASLAVVVCLGAQQVAVAQPFGVGLFGENVPFGSETSLSITPSGGTFSGTGSHTITVTSTDVVGYDLYVNTTAGTAMSNGTDTIPASANTTPAALSTNSWGYNTTGSTTNFKGMTATQALINSGTGPFTSGAATSATYGALIDITKSAGTYSVNVTYTAIGRT